MSVRFRCKIPRYSKIKMNKNKCNEWFTLDLTKFTICKTFHKSFSKF